MICEGAYREGRKTIWNNPFSLIARDITVFGKVDGEDKEWRVCLREDGSCVEEGEKYPDKVLEFVRRKLPPIEDRKRDRDLARQEINRWQKDDAIPHPDASYTKEVEYNFDARKRLVPIYEKLGYKFASYWEVSSGVNGIIEILVPPEMPEEDNFRKNEKG